MKNQAAMLATIICALAAFMSGCSVSTGNMGHTTDTQVHLSEANFRVVKTVTGEATQRRVFGLGPSRADLVGRAKRDMIDQANLEEGSRALINMTTDSSRRTVLIYGSRTIYVTAEVIEFTD